MIPSQVSVILAALSWGLIGLLAAAVWHWGTFLLLLQMAGVILLCLAVITLFALTAWSFEWLLERWR